MTVTSRLCKGCGYCEHNCPKGAVTLSGAFNEAGYPTPAVDAEKCILCGVCYNVCPEVVFTFTEEEA